MQNLFAGFRRVCLTLPAVLGLLTIGGCDIINPDESAPTYLRVAPFAYSAGVPGSPTTANATAAFVYANNLLVGVFDLPAKIPVLQQGQVRLRFVPAIYPDGQRGTRVTYPFYTAYSQSALLQPEATVRVNPTTGFDAPAVELPSQVQDDFSFDDGVSRAFTLASAAAYRQEAAVSDTFRTDVGRVQGIAGKTDVFLLQSVWRGVLPNRGAAVYLELDYRSTMPFQVGVQHGINYATDLTVYPSRTWTKLYVNLTQEVSSVNNAATEFQVFIQGFPTGAANDFFAFDNVRLIRPKI
ncbi:MAG: hypothetical protein H7330_00745 [Hymenobacteraceae bacterium]|nr:hypothetical protein [Hymenobacteraceae bacterium]